MSSVTFQITGVTLTMKGPHLNSLTFCLLVSQRGFLKLIL